MKGLTALLLALVLLAGCQRQYAPAASDPPPPSEASQTPPEPAQASVSSLPPQEAMEQAAAACADLTASIDAGAGYYPLNSKQTEMLMERVASLGFPVTARGFDMKNYEQVLAFGEAVKAGNAARTGIFEVSDNGLSLTTLAQDGQRQTYQLTVSYFPLTETGGDEPVEITGIGLRNGYLMYGEYAVPESALMQPCGGFRVEPLGPEKREACRRYVEPVFHSAGRLMSADWDESDLSGLELQYAFETLYQLDTGVTLYDAGFPQNSQTFAYTIPAEIVERVMTKYLPVTAENLRLSRGYDAAQTAYHWGCFAGGGYAPVPEVTEIRENEDGTVTLRVSGTSVEFGQEQSSACALTIAKTEADGFRYVSNRVLPDP